MRVYFGGTTSLGFNMGALVFRRGFKGIVGCKYMETTKEHHRVYVDTGICCRDT